MGRLHLGAKQDAMTGLPQARAKLDVLNARPAIGLIEAARREKGRAPDGTASGPERAGFAVAALVDIVML